MECRSDQRQQLVETLAHDSLPTIIIVPAPDQTEVNDAHLIRHTSPDRPHNLYARDVNGVHHDDERPGQNEEIKKGTVPGTLCL
jgi:hypothetical protein